MFRSSPFFPGMSLPVERKLACVEACLDVFAKIFDVRSLEEHARLLNNTHIKSSAG